MADDDPDRGEHTEEVDVVPVLPADARGRCPGCGGGGGPCGVGGGQGLGGDGWSLPDRTRGDIGAGYERAVSAGKPCRMNIGHLRVTFR
ncbi:hypothetical protein GCM10010220_10900 [Streptomyces parvulus]|nr:hypothetical protein GCM10010220_10900 [Streptomyces parvulus]